MDTVKNYAEDAEAREVILDGYNKIILGEMITKICILPFFLVNLYVELEEDIC